MRVKILILLLAVGTLVLYWPVRHFDFLYYDDPYFVINPGVVAGLNWHTLAWAMTDIVFKDWHPITLLSFLLTHQLFGINQGAEHLVNVEFHAANAVLLFLVLLRLTGATWRSAMVAAIFAWHPLRVESVCWVAERKDVLFAFFMLLSLLCYAEYAQRQKEDKSGTENPPSDWYGWNLPYISSLVFFILSFLNKGMVATLPFLLLLLDFWPLQRFQRVSVRQLAMEKVPFFALTFFFSALTFWIHKKYGDIWSTGDLSMTWRAENAVWSYLKYLAQMIWPINLAIIYPYPKSFNHMELLCAALLLVAISILSILELSRRPYLAMGWFWYLGTMFPVCGLVEFGQSAMGDRFTYIPLIGPVISLVWLVSEWVGTHRVGRFLVTMSGIVILAVFIILTRQQMMCWQNTVTLFQHAVDVTPENAFAHYPLGMGLEENSRLRQAAIQYRVAIAEDPGYKLEYFKLEYFHLGCVLARLGQYREGFKDLETALQYDPNGADSMNGLARLLATCPEADLRDGTRALKLSQQACELTYYQKANYVGTLAAAYAETGQYDEAIVMAEKAVALARKHHQPEWIPQNQKRLASYQAHQAYHSASSDDY
jgi:tetratricopeptide (TPR) repeat protein